MSQQWQSAPQAPPGSYEGGNGPSGPRAGFWIRLGAYVLDAIIYSIPAVILVLVAALISDALVAVVYALVVIAGIGYFVYFEGGPSGATPGKRICGIRVYDINGAPQIGYGRAFIRYLMKIVSAIPIYLGFLWMLWDKEKQCWHDKVAGDVVVPRDAYR